MKRIKHFLLLLAATALTTAANAQVINGDLNHSGKLEVSDVTRLINNYLTGTVETINIDPFTADNSRIVGTWYKSPTESITFNADGTTDYLAGYTYEFLPLQGYVVFSNASGAPVYALRVLKIESDQLMTLPTGSSVPEVYSTTLPVSITLSQTSLSLKPDEFTRLTATVVPSDVGTVTWSSSNESVATVVSGFVTAVADGTAIITAEVAGAKATCMVTVKSSTPVTKITLSSTSLTLWNDGSTKTLTATVSPSTATTKTLNWTSSSTSVATVSSSGVVTPKSAGTTTITASATDGSGVKATCTVTVKALTGTNNGYTWVDLGLSVKWATVNVGATVASGYGYYYAWGETTTKSTYSWSTYKYGTSSTNLTKYNDVDGKTVLDLSDDAARQKWGGTWRMPTYDELKELKTQCRWTWTTQNGVNGYKVASMINGNSIFLPTTGCRDGSSLFNAGSTGNYWSSSLYASSPDYAYRLGFRSDGIDWNIGNRYDGQSVRPVCP